MSDATHFFNAQLKSALLSMNTAFPAEVLSYNEVTRTAKIQPKFQMKEVGRDPENIAPIEDVPVQFQRFKVDGVVKEYIPILQVGDIVQVLCNQRALDGALERGKTVCPSKARFFSMNDAVIVGVIA